MGGAWRWISPPIHSRTAKVVASRAARHSHNFRVWLMTPLHKGDDAMLAAAAAGCPDPDQVRPIARDADADLLSRAAPRVPVPAGARHRRFPVRDDRPAPGLRPG